MKNGNGYLYDRFGDYTCGGIIYIVSLGVRVTDDRGCKQQITMVII